jgi:DNA-binding winged helix-turn-helix (wHTH) protein/dipeptidyl aminopeptidase/acylaminoacyl peptidase
MTHAQAAFEFGPFRLEPAKRRLLREGEPLPLTPKAFDTLLLLVQNHERVVEKDEVMRLVWPDTVVEESNLAQNIFTLRRALGDSPEGARFIATIPRRGYRFVAEVTAVENGAEPAAVPAPSETAAVRPSRRALGPAARATAVALALALLPLGGYLAGRRADDPVQPKLQRLTFRRGVVRGARFAPDGRTVVYSASWDGGATYVYLSRPESPESMTLDVPPAEVLAVSPGGELALGLRPAALYQQMGNFQTLARVALTGGTPREFLENVEAADWSPDGQSLAVVRKVENRAKRLEYPIGRVLVETTSSQCLDRPRVSPDGRKVAFIECHKPSLTIAVSDGPGQMRAIWTGTEWVSGLAWSPRGDEIWFSTETQFRLPQARAVDLSGRERPLAALPGAIADVSRDGAVLMTTGRRGSGIRGRAPGDREERELSWLEGSAAADLSRDGRQLLFGEMMEGGGFNGRIYLRGTDGSPAVHLGDGYPLALSPDGAWAAVRLRSRPEAGGVHHSAGEGLTLLPTGAGEARAVALGEMNAYLAQWFPDGRRLLLGGMVPGREGRLYVLDSHDASLRPLTAEMTGVGALSPDGKWVATIGHDGHFLYPVEGGERRALPGLSPEEWPVGWAADGRSLFLRREGELPMPVLRMDVATGRKEPWMALAPPDRAGVVYMQPLVTGDGRSYVYTYHRALSDLYLVLGLR